MVRKTINNAALTIALYTLAAWIYVAAVAVVTPQYLPLQLTHLLSWPRTDTFGEICFVVSLVSFFVYRMTRPDPNPMAGNPAGATPVAEQPVVEPADA